MLSLKKRILKYKYIIFDCDGVILQSNSIKTNAFFKTLRDEPKDLVKKFINYHKINGGISRYKKLQYYFSKLKKEKNYHDLVESAIQRYASIVQDSLMKVDFVPGVLSFIDFLNINHSKCLVISGGDQNELIDIFKKRNIYNKFKKILGSPIGKKEHIINLISNKELEKPAIFFGDSYADFDAANNYKIDFCFVSQFSEWDNGLKLIDKQLFETIFNFNDINE